MRMMSEIFSKCLGRGWRNGGGRGILKFFSEISFFQQSQANKIWLKPIQSGRLRNFRFPSIQTGIFSPDIGTEHMSVAVGGSQESVKQNALLRSRFCQSIALSTPPARTPSSATTSFTKNNWKMYGHAFAFLPSFLVFFFFFYSHVFRHRWIISCWSTTMIGSFEWFNWKSEAQWTTPPIFLPFFRFR